MSILRELHERSGEIRDGGKTIKATLVTPDDRAYVDKEAVKKLLSASDIMKISKVVIDDKKLESEMDNNPRIFDAVASNTTFRPVKPYIKLTEGQADDSWSAS